MTVSGRHHHVRPREPVPALLDPMGHANSKFPTGIVHVVPQSSQLIEFYHGSVVKGEIIGSGTKAALREFLPEEHRFVQYIPQTQEQPVSYVPMFFEPLSRPSEKQEEEAVFRSRSRSRSRDDSNSVADSSPLSASAREYIDHRQLGSIGSLPPFLSLTDKSPQREPSPNSSLFEQPFASPPSHCQHNQTVQTPPSVKLGDLTNQLQRNHSRPPLHTAQAATQAKAPPSQKPAPEPVMEPLLQQLRGLVVKRINKFGFICTSDDTGAKEVFFHVEELKSSCFFTEDRLQAANATTLLPIGSHVLFETERDANTNNKSMKAVNLVEVNFCFDEALFLAATKAIAEEKSGSATKLVKGSRD